MSLPIDIIAKKQYHPKDPTISRRITRIATRASI